MNAFVGSYALESRDNFEPFLRGIGIAEEHIEMVKNNKQVDVEISVDGDTITVTRKRPIRTSTQTFKLGHPTEIETLKGDKVQVTLNLVDGKLVAKGDKYLLTSEIDGGKLKEAITLNGHSMSRVFSRK